jgi:hypothetical protein
MRKLMPKRRPSAGVIVGFLALVVALGGGAYAAKSKKITYKTLDKDARLKVLPISATNAGTSANPNAPGTFTDLTSVSTNVSTAFPRRVHLVFDGIVDSVGAASSRGDCRLEADNVAIQGTTIRVDASPHQADHGEGVGINIVTTPLGGKHTFSVACNENAGDLRVQQFQLSALTVR